MHKKLFIPGPVEVRPEVLEKMATPMIGHRTKDAPQLQREISELAMKLFYTKNQILLSTTSGSGLMEGAIRCCTRKRAAVFSIGPLATAGSKWRKTITFPLIKLIVNGDSQHCLNRLIKLCQPANMT